MNIKTIERNRERFYANTHGLTLLTDFTGWNDDVLIQCNVCGHEFERSFQVVKHGNRLRCPKCRKEETEERAKARDRKLREERKAQFEIDEEERRRSMVEKYQGFTYVGNYTGSDGTVDVRHEPCGSILTKSWVTIRHSRNKNLECPFCEKREVEQKRLKAEEEKKRKAVQAHFVKQARIKSKQLEMRVCLHCGKTFFSTTQENYCSPKCQKATNNAIKKDRRLRKLKAANYDSTISLPRVFDRDNGVCYLCGEPCDWDDYEMRDGTLIAGNRYPSVDHVVAIHDGGSHTWDNVRLAHRWCNSIKG